MHQEDRKSQKLKESQKDDRAQLVFMKKQLSLLEEIKGHLVKRGKLPLLSNWSAKKRCSDI